VDAQGTAAAERRGRGGWLVALALLWLAAPHAGPALGQALGTAPDAGTRHPMTAGQSPSPIAARAVRFALAQVGKPYQWGAEGPAAFDCSGLVWAAYHAAGLAWPRLTAADQWRATRAHPVARGELQAGDLVFFAWNPADWTTIHHVGLAVSATRMVEAPHVGAPVRVAAIGWAGWFAATRPAPRQAQQGGGGR
jgi:cell wall-associated NlpC family hydrolase